MWHSVNSDNLTILEAAVKAMDNSLFDSRTMSALRSVG